MRRKLLTIALPRDEFLTLEELADLQERTPQQQALFLLRGVLREDREKDAVEEQAGKR